MMSEKGEPGSSGAPPSFWMFPNVTVAASALTNPESDTKSLYITLPSFIETTVKMARLDVSVQPPIPSSATSASNANANSFNVFMSVSLAFAIPIARVLAEGNDGMNPAGDRARDMPRGVAGVVGREGARNRSVRSHSRRGEAKTIAGAVQFAPAPADLQSPGAYFLAMP